MELNKRNWGIFSVFLLFVFCISGCSNRSVSVGKIQRAELPEQIVETTAAEYSDVSGKSPLYEVMDRIAVNQGGDKAADYKEEIKDTSEDALVFLCASESGKYKAYGCISPEYGRTGILLNNTIDGLDNYNYLIETWSYGSDRPALEEQGEYEVLFSFSQPSGKQEIYFDTYDMGTMSAR